VTPATARIVACFAAASLVALGAPRTGKADEPDARVRAQELLEQGNRLFREGDMREALARYRQAYDVFASPRLFFNIARCEESLGDRTGAIRDFTHFLDGAPDASEDARAEARERVDALAPLLGALAIEGETNQLVQIDDQRVGVTPLKAPIWVEPGAHRVTVSRSTGAPWSTSIIAHPGEHLTVAAPAPPAPPAEVVPIPDTGPGPTRPEPAAPPGSPWNRWWLWTGLGAVVVGGAVAAFLLTRNQCPSTATAGCQ
jgi:hypothetical protein